MSSCMAVPFIVVLGRAAKIISYENLACECVDRLRASQYWNFIVGNLGYSSYKKIRREV